MTAVMYALFVVYVIMMLAAMFTGGELWYPLLEPAWPLFLGYLAGLYVCRYSTDYNCQLKSLSEQSGERSKR